MMSDSRFDFVATPIPGLTLVQRKPIRDARGFFARFFCGDDFQAAGFSFSIVQINHTLTHRKGAVRGLHFQYPPHAEMKMVSCLQGQIFDVAVDIRRNSPTFLRWHAEILSADNQRSLLIPEGFAHGFQTLTEECELIYLHSKAYNPTSEGALNIGDPALAIPWPERISEISERDRSHPFIDEGYSGISL